MARTILLVFCGLIMIGSSILVLSMESTSRLEKLSLVMVLSVAYACGLALTWSRLPRIRSGKGVKNK